MYYAYGIKNSEMNSQFENQVTCFPFILKTDVIKPVKEVEYKITTVSEEISINKESTQYQF